MQLFALVVGSASLLLPLDALAGCCRVVKVDTESPTVLVRVCEPDAQGACGALLFQGTLASGDDQALCTASPTLVYQEWDDSSGDFGAPVEAMCEGGDVEI